MINNRQNGRRRGRGGGPRTPNAPSPGNRQDNRSRGNASQLHEKYKALARDTQLAGDRVQTEYYLQFADHYFRVLNESRARFEEQRPSRNDYAGDDDDQDQDDGMNNADGDDTDGDDRDERPVREARYEREPRQDNRGDREPREPRPESRPEPRADREPREARPRRARTPAPERDGNRDDGIDARISLDSLPPAIASVDDGEERAPRRRTRRPRTDNDDTDIAPAA